MNSETTGDLWQYVNCALCGADWPVSVTHDWQKVAGQRYTFNLVRCQNCGLVYINPRLNREALIGSAGGGAWHSALAVNRTIYETGCHRLRQLLRSDSGGRPTLLDVGCAYGDFLTVAREHGFDVAGVDIDKPVAEVARQRGFVVLDDLLEELALPGESFDAVTLWDVIEHVGDPKALLAETVRVLKPGGILFFHTGNAAFQVPKGRVLAALRPGRGPYNAPVQHMYHFSASSSRALLARAGKFDHLEFTHLDTIRYRQRRKYLAMKAYNEATRLLARLGLPLWTSSLAVLARKAG